MELALLIVALIVVALIVIAVVFALAFARITAVERSLHEIRRQMAALTLQPPAAAAPPFQGEPRAARLAAPESPAAAPRAPSEPVPQPGPHAEAAPLSGTRALPSAGIPLADAPRPSQESLETAIGSRWLLYVGMVAIVVGVGYFEKLAFDNQWIGETARVLQGGALGLVLLYVGHRFIRSGFGLYGQMICGGATAILYVSTYASFNFYHLIGRADAFVLMCGITAIGALLADHHRSQGLAVLAVGGGFITPFMLPSASDAEIALFGYDAVLIAGTMVLAGRRDWPLLNLVSYGLTVLTVLTWAGTFYWPAKFLRTEIFLTIFCAMFLYILWRAQQHEVRLRLLSWPLWTAPMAYYAASLAILTPHSTAMLVWLVALGLVAAAVVAEQRALSGFVVWLVTIWPLLLWANSHGHRPWLVPGTFALCGVYALVLMAHLRSTAASGPPSPAQIALLHANPLATFAGLYLLIDPIDIDAPAKIAAGFALVQFAIAGATWGDRRDQARQFAAVGAALLAVAIALQFGGAWITIGWAVEGAAVIALGLREDREWLRGAGVLLFALAVIRTLLLLAADATISESVLMNRRAACGLVVAGLLYLLAWLHRRRQAAVDYSFDVAAALVVAKVVVFGLVTSEIYSYWATRPGSIVARDMALSIAWAVYATALAVIGLRLRYAPIRYVAFVVFGVTILKVFLVDLAQLNRIYRVLSVIVLGIALLLTSYLYNRTKRQPAGLEGQ